MRKGRKYECPNCGYESARWHIYLTDVYGSKCERCYVAYMNGYIHIREFRLHEDGQRKR